MAVISPWKGIIAVKPEATAFTAETTMADTNRFPAFDVSFKSTPDLISVRTLNQTWGKVANMAGARIKGELTYSIYLRGQSGTAGAALYYADQLKMCGLSVTNTPGSSNTIAPSETFTGATIYPARSYSVWYYEDGKIYKMSGCQANLKLIAKAGEPAVLQFTVMGCHWETVDGAIAPTSGVSTNVPPNFVGATMSTIGTETPILETLELDLGNDIQEYVEANAPTGLRGYRIMNRAPKGKMNPEDTTLLDIAYWTQVRNGTTGALSTGNIGTGTGNKWSLSSSLIQYQNVTMGERGGARILDIEFDVKTASGAAEGAEFTLTIGQA
jgi:hypothetical protein